MAAAGRIMELVSQRLIPLSLEQAIATETLETIATILAVILSICGLSSFVLAFVTNVASISFKLNYLKYTLGM